MSDTRQLCLPVAGTLRRMADSFGALVERFLLASAEFERRLRLVLSEQWAWPTPCAEWNVWQLVNHMARGNLNYANLLHGGTSAEFIRLRDIDALGTDPVGAYVGSVRVCASAFTEPGAPDRILDYPLGKVAGRQSLAVRTTDCTIHTWDLARAIGADDHLNVSLVTWIASHLEKTYAGLAESPTDINTTHRFFAAPRVVPADNASAQDRLLRLMGRTPGRGW